MRSTSLFALALLAAGFALGAAEPAAARACDPDFGRCYGADEPAPTPRAIARPRLSESRADCCCEATAPMRTDRARPTFYGKSVIAPVYRAAAPTHDTVVARLPEPAPRKTGGEPGPGPSDPGPGPGPSDPGPGPGGGGNGPAGNAPAGGGNGPAGGNGGGGNGPAF